MKKSLVFLLLVTALIACAFSLGASAAPAKTALLVCITDPSVNESDLLVTQNLEKLGFKVTQVDHVACGDENPDKYGLVVISSTSTSGNIVTAATYLTTATPVLFWESALLDDYKFATDLGAYDYDSTESAVKESSHPIMAGFGKSFVPFDGAVNIHTGVAAEGKVLAVLPDEKATIIVADKGDKLLDGFVSPNRRAFITAGDVAWESANKDGWKFFNQTIAWLTAN